MPDLMWKFKQPPEDGATLMVSSGKAQFGIDFQEYLAPAFKPGEEMNVSAVAAIIQHNTSGLISLKEKGIDSPKSLKERHMLHGIWILKKVL